jgi:peroxiredoxin (alkyl hydroperoxide reductase subunit C)
MEIARKYGMLHPGYSGTQTVRAVFIIDPQEVIRAILYYPASTGRNMEEIKRMILSLQKADSEQIATPANWNPCEDVILPPPGTCGTANERVARVNENMYCLDWFLCFRQSECPANDDYYEPEMSPYPSNYQRRNRVRHRMMGNRID